MFSCVKKEKTHTVDYSCKCRVLNCSRFYLYISPYVDVLRNLLPVVSSCGWGWMDLALVWRF